MTFRLVRGEPTDSMIEAAQEEISERQKVGCGIYLADIWPVVLAAQEPLTDAEIDELCRLWWSDSRHWHGDLSAQRYEYYRDNDRTRMRAFINALEGHKP